MAVRPPVLSPAIQLTQIEHSIWDGFGQTLTASGLIPTAMPLIPGQVLNAAASLLDALGAFALRKENSFGRHWRNARALASHNPRLYKERIIGAVSASSLPSHEDHVLVVWGLKRHLAL